MEQEKSDGPQYSERGKAAYMGKGSRLNRPQEGNVMDTNRVTYDTTTKLERIAWLSSRNPSKSFGNLMHLFNEQSLRECFHMLDGRKAVGTDGIRKDDYELKLEANIASLTNRLKEMSYRPSPARQVMIPKDTKGSFRPLGISNLEDKIIQKMLARVLDAVFDPIFLESSYGFRKGKGCHDAIRDLYQYLFTQRVESVVDVDIENFFGSIDHRVLLDAVKQKIADETLQRYLSRMLKAGTLIDGDLKVSDEGTPQGSIASPILANIFAHFVLDEWFESTVKQHCKGKVAMFRYADDFVICCEMKSDSERILRALANRLAKYGMKVSEKKTKLVNFSKRQASQGIRQDTFDFLGFTFYLGKSQKGNFTPRVKTSSKRMRSKLRKLKEWLKTNRSKFTLDEIWKRLKLGLQGHFNYFGVTFNLNPMQNFAQRSSNLVFKWINRRSQRRSMDWTKFTRYMNANPLPAPRIIHSLFQTNS